MLLPARNAQATLGAALESVLRSTERSLELIVVDDASTDGTRAIAESVRDPRVRIVAGEGRGLVAALERGRAECTAPWIARMDADDLMHRDRLRAQLEACEANDWDACGAHVRMFPRSGLGDGARAYEAWIASLRSSADIMRDAFIECPLVHPTLFVRRELLSYRDQPWPEDYDLVLRLLADDRRLGIVPRRLLGWRESATRLSRTDPRYSLEAFAACKAHFLARGPLASTNEYVLLGYGPTGKLLRTALRREGREAALLVDLKPGRIGQVIDGARVVGPDALASLPKLPLLVAVSGAGPRALVCQELVGREFVCCA